MEYQLLMRKNKTQSYTKKKNIILKKLFTEQTIVLYYDQNEKLFNFNESNLI